MPVQEFERLGGTNGRKAFASKLAGLVAKKIFEDPYKKKPQKQRTNTSWRNYINRYPCGILEQAYREVMAREQSRESRTSEAATPRASSGVVRLVK